MVREAARGCASYAKCRLGHASGAAEAAAASTKLNLVRLDVHDGAEIEVPIIYWIDGKKRSVEIPGTLHMSVDPLPTAHPSGEMCANAGHPVSPDKLALAVGAAGTTFSGHGMHWDNSGRNGHYAPIRWSNQS